MHGKYNGGTGCSMSDARMTAMGDEHPDFSGPGYGATKRMLILISPEGQEVESSDQPDASPLDVLTDIASQLQDVGVPESMVVRMQDAIATMVADGPTSDQPAGDDATDRLTEGTPLD